MLAPQKRKRLSSIPIQRSIGPNLTKSLFIILVGLSGACATSPFISRSANHTGPGGGSAHTNGSSTGTQGNSTTEPPGGPGSIPGVPGAPGMQAPPVAVTPHLGIILGPGGAKAISEVGVLRELESAKVPVEAIVGLEWGALVGGLYAVEGRTNDVEWKIGKLKPDYFPHEKLFGSAIEPVSIDEFIPYLKTVFENKQVQAIKIPFTCPTFSVVQNKVVWMQNGSLVAGIQYCLPYPPVFSMPPQAFARPREIASAVEWLRQHGITHILLINPIGSSHQIIKKSVAHREMVESLWKEVRAEINNSRNWVNWIIDIPTDDVDMTAAPNVRSLIDLGRRASQPHIQDLAHQLGY